MSDNAPLEGSRILEQPVTGMSITKLALNTFEDIPLLLPSLHHLIHRS